MEKREIEELKEIAKNLPNEEMRRFVLILNIREKMIKEGLWNDNPILDLLGIYLFEKMENTEDEALFKEEVDLFRETLDGLIDLVISSRKTNY